MFVIHFFWFDSCEQVNEQNSLFLFSFPAQNHIVNISFDPAGPERDRKEVNVRLKSTSTVVPVDSGYSSNDKSFGLSKLE